MINHYKSQFIITFQSDKLHHTTSQMAVDINTCDTPKTERPTKENEKKKKIIKTPIKMTCNYPPQFVL